MKPEWRYWKRGIDLRIGFWLNCKPTCFSCLWRCNICLIIIVTKTPYHVLGFCDRSSWANYEMREKTNKMQRMFIFNNISTCFGHHYAHLISNFPRLLQRSTLHAVIRLVLLKMGIMMSETCWDIVKNKHLLHLVGFLSHFTISCCFIMLYHQNYRRPAVRKGTQGPTVLHLFVSFSVIPYVIWWRLSC